MLTSIKIHENPTAEQWDTLLKRPQKSDLDLQETVVKIFEEVKSHQDKALMDYTLKFDGVRLSNIKINTADFIKKATDALPKDLIEAIEIAHQNIGKFHRSQVIKPQVIETCEGVQCWQEMKAIEKVGLYVPGGTAPLFSTMLMLGIPAKIAGCKEIVLCTPPNKKGSIHPAIVYTAHLMGMETIYTVGGIQAIAAMTYGTKTIPSVYKIFGPGNQYVTAAKQYALNKGIAIDMPAGPSEVLVVADKDANPDFVAADLLSQAEHGADSQVICLASSKEKLQAITTATERLLATLPRKTFAQKSIENSRFIVFSELKKQIKFIDEYAPEHLILNVLNSKPYLDNIVNAGSVFIGPHTPESAGDYASGTNHTLPTNGHAKMYSGVNMDAFTKKITYQTLSPKGIENIGSAVATMAKHEGLDAHKLAMDLRIASIKKSSKS